jgi:hypothetical protein
MQPFDIFFPILLGAFSVFLPIKLYNELRIGVIKGRHMTISREKHPILFYIAAVLGVASTLLIILWFILSIILLITEGSLQTFTPWPFSY